MTGTLPSGEELLRRLETNDFVDEGADVNDLVSAIYDGFPVQRLSAALRSRNVRTVENALFVASESGWRSAALVDDLLPLTGHRSGKVRYRVAEVCLLALPDDTRLLSAAIDDLLNGTPVHRLLLIRIFLKLDDETVARETERLIALSRADSPRTALADLLSLLWAIQVLRSGLAPREKMSIIDESPATPGDLREPLVTLILEPWVRREKRKARSNEEGRSWS